MSIILEVVAGRVISGEIVMLRILRLLLGISAGMGLGITGASLQRVYKNPLADGYILGISGGAVLGIAVSEFTRIPLSNSVLALLFSLGVGAVIVFASMRLSEIMVPVFGLGIGMFFSSLAILFFMLAGVETTKTFYTLWGSLGKFFSISDIPVSIVILTATLLFASLMVVKNKELDVVSLGNLESMCLGYDPRGITVFATMVSSIIVSLITSYIGIVGFVGIMSPHIARLLGLREGPEFYLYSGVIGSILVLIADSSGRVILGIDPPIGIIMSIAGAPFFVYLVVSEARR